MRRLFFQLSLFALCLGVVVTAGYADVTDNDEQVLEETQTADNDDIEEKVDSEVQVAQGRKGNGVVWGKAAAAKKQEETEDREEPVKTAQKPVQTRTERKSEPQKTTVKRPVIPESAAAAKQDKKQDKAPSSDAKETYRLKSKRRSGSADLVETLLEVTGDVKLMSEQQKPVSDKMEVVAGFRYEERVRDYSTTEERLSGARQYNLAKAKMKIGDDLKTPELNEELQTIVCRLEKDHVTLFSPKGSLRGEELLLIEDLPGNTLTLDRLLPDKEVAIGESWPVSDGVLRSFLSIDAVTEANVEAILTAVSDDMAMIEIVGDVNGVYLGAATELGVRAKYQFDLNLCRINWLGLLIEENRSIGHVGPGFDLVARLQVKISPLDAPQSLTDDVFKEAVGMSNEKTLKLKYDGGKGPWRFAHDRSWYIIQDDPQTTILRKLNRGELVAQCNIADMGRVDRKTMTTLAKFRKELQDGLGDSFGKVVSADEMTGPDGYLIYSVLIDGVVDDLPLRWIYNLLTDSDGRQAVVVFVVEATMLPLFGAADEELMKTFKIGKR